MGVWGATEQKRQLSSVACSDRCKTCELFAKRAGVCVSPRRWRLQKLQKSDVSQYVLRPCRAWAADLSDDASTKHALKGLTALPVPLLPKPLLGQVSPNGLSCSFHDVAPEFGACLFKCECPRVDGQPV
jgi:hypothetical protein